MEEPLQYLHELFHSIGGSSVVIGLFVIHLVALIIVVWLVAHAPDGYETPEEGFRYGIPPEDVAAIRSAAAE